MLIVEEGKFVPYRVRKFGLPSQRKLSYFKSREMLRENGFVISNIAKNCVFPNGGSESTKHWMIKCIIFKILRQRKREVGTEVEVNNAVIDVLDITNMIGYEVETDLNKFKVMEKMRHFDSVKDVFFIDTREVPDDILEAERYLSSKLV